MKLYAPKYYKDFSCIADRCKHSCCVGWEIDIDERTLSKYESYESGYGKAVRESIEQGESAYFRLSECGRCPHLDARGLCNIITHLGEGELCDICREHPRYYNASSGVALVGLGMCCEEAARIILSSDGYSEFLLLGEYECKPSGFDSFGSIKDIYKMLSDRSIPYSDRLSHIAREYGASIDGFTESMQKELLYSLEYLDPQNRERFSTAYDRAAHNDCVKLMLERAFAYFIFRYVGEAENPSELRSAVMTALLFERILSSVAAREGIECEEGFAELCRTLSEELEYSEDNIDEIRLELSFL